MLGEDKQGVENTEMHEKTPQKSERKQSFEGAVS